MSVEVLQADPATVSAWIDGGEAYLVDVREAAEHARERIAGATLVPLSCFDAGAFAPAADNKLVLHCQSGVRCGMAAEQLVAAGFDGTIYRLRGGLLNWKEAGYPVEPGA